MLLIYSTSTLMRLFFIAHKGSDIINRNVRLHHYNWASYEFKLFSIILFHLVSAVRAFATLDLR